MAASPEAPAPGSASPLPTSALPGQPPYVFHVAVDGSDQNPGTAEEPFASVEHARDVIRGVPQDAAEPITVFIHHGTYFLETPIQFNQADSGRGGFDITYAAAAGERPVFSGGIAVTGWQPVEGGAMWKATLGDVGGFRQMYVNGNRARRAASEQPVTGLRFAENAYYSRGGIEMAAATLPDLSRPSDLELHWIYDWKDMRLPVDDVQANDSGTKTVWMHQPSFDTALSMGTWNDGKHYWYPKPEVPFYLENGIEFLDQPGEWYFDRETRDLFYLPRTGEDMTTAEVMIPQTERLLEITGGIIGKEVHNLVFDGLTFEYAGWTRPSEVGAITNQAQMLLDSANGNAVMVPAHVELSSTSNIRFERCRFEHLGAVGLHFGNNVTNTVVEGSLFHDISQAAVVIGHWDDAYPTRKGVQRAPAGDRVANNLITRIGAEYWGAAAVTAYFTSGLEVVHNELLDLPHGGIGVGWGWSMYPSSTTAHDNLVANNLVMDFNQIARDGGGVYILGQQPGTIVEGNVLRRMHQDYACLYADEGSESVTFMNNVCDTAPRWLHVNMSRGATILNTYTNVIYSENDSAGIRIENTVYVNGQEWPPEALAIIENAGLEPAYAYLHDWLNE